MSNIAVIITRTLGLLFVALTFVAVSEAKDWRGIKPLHSTRADVERSLGQPQQGSKGSYSTADETILVSYSESPCAHGWNVPPGTVISLSVYPKKPLKIDTLGISRPGYANAATFILSIFTITSRRRKALTTPSILSKASPPLSNTIRQLG